MDVALISPSNTPGTNRAHLVRRVIALSWFTIVYNLIEGLVSIFFGVSDESIALAGFGFDSWIEVASAFLVLWRFQGETGRATAPSRAREKKATLGIGVLFLALAGTASVASVFQLLSKAHPDTTLPGVVISTLSLSFMFYLWSAKKKLALALDSSTVMSDASCSLACIKLSVVLFLGSLLFQVFPGFWWADGVAGLVLGAFIGKEGWDMIQATRKEDFSGCCGCS